MDIICVAERCMSDNTTSRTAVATGDRFARPLYRRSPRRCSSCVVATGDLSQSTAFAKQVRTVPVRAAALRLTAAKLSKRLPQSSHVCAVGRQWRQHATTACVSSCRAHPTHRSSCATPACGGRQWRPQSLPPFNQTKLLTHQKCRDISPSS